MTVYRALLIKEARALLPLWGACTLAIVFHMVAASPLTESIAVFAYLLGTAAMGASAIGDELSARTFSVQLVQPVSRRALFLAKMLVLAAMLAVLGTLGWFATFGGRALAPPSELAFLPVLGGLFAAPWITLATRNPLAGIVFPLSAAAILFAAIDFAAPIFVGDTAAARLAFVVWSRGLFVLSAVAAVMCWRAFMRFEVIEGGQAGFQVPRWLAADDTLRTPGAFGRLVRKELYLQQMTFAFPVLYVVGWMVLYVNLDAAGRDQAFVALTTMYVLIVSLVAGSLASAEERHLGMLEIQRLLPVAAWQQWVIKATLTFAVVLVIGVAVPVALAMLTGMGTSRSGEMEVPGVILGMIGVVTTISLYASSLSASGTRAVGVAFLGCAVIAGLLSRIVMLVFLNPRLEQQIWWGSVGTLALVLMAFAAVNHNSSERSVRRIAIQLAVAAAIIPVGSRLVLAFSSL